MQVHERTPLHAFMGGGDQIYNDRVWSLPSLKAWVEIEKIEVNYLNEPGRLARISMLDYLCGLPVPAYARLFLVRTLSSDYSQNLHVLAGHMCVHAEESQLSFNYSPSRKAGVVYQERLLHAFTEYMELQVTEFYFNHSRCLLLFLLTCCS